jgi:hypothetical protein
MAKRIFKGIMHVHSTYSGDADFTIAEIKNKLAQGLDFILFTEHNNKGMTKKSFENFLRDCKKNSSKEFLCISGLEIEMGRVHTLLYGMSEFFYFEDDKKNKEEIKKAIRKGCVGVLAHPPKVLVSKELAEELDGVEVWNFDYNGAKTLPLYQFKLFRKFLRINNKLFAFLGYDFHRTMKREQVVCLELESLSKENILAELKEGRFWYEVDEYKIYPTGDVVWKDKPLNKYFFKMTKLRCVSVCTKSLHSVLRAGTIVLNVLGVRGKFRLFLGNVVKKMYGKV